VNRNKPPLLFVCNKIDEDGTKSAGRLKDLIEKELYVTFPFVLPLRPPLCVFCISTEFLSSALEDQIEGYTEFIARSRRR
jgi:hypothetical protein